MAVSLSGKGKKCFSDLSDLNEVKMLTTLKYYTEAK